MEKRAISSAGKIQSRGRYMAWPPKSSHGRSSTERSTSSQTAYWLTSTSRKNSKHGLPRFRTFSVKSSCWSTACGILKMSDVSTCFALMLRASS